MQNGLDRHLHCTSLGLLVVLWFQKMTTTILPFHWWLQIYRKIFTYFHTVRTSKLNSILSSQKFCPRCPQTLDSGAWAPKFGKFGTLVLSGFLCKAIGNNRRKTTTTNYNGWRKQPRHGPSGWISQTWGTTTPGLLQTQLSWKRWNIPW